MSARRTARELAVIVMPQLPKDRNKLERTEIEDVVAKAVHMLVEYSKQSLLDASAFLTRAHKELLDIEIEHDTDENESTQLQPAAMTTDQVRAQIDMLERAVHLISDAIEIPDMALHNGKSYISVACKKCDHSNEVLIDRPSRSEVRDYVFELVSTYVEHQKDIDTFIKQAKSKWKVERMVSIDRDILRLACTEAFFISTVPINVCVSEAVSLSHEFADEKAAKFINGVLADLVAEAQHFRRTGKFRELPKADDNGAAVSSEQNGDGEVDGDGNSQ